MTSVRRLVVTAIACLSMLMLPVPASSAYPGQEVWGPHATPYGLSYDRWFARWSVWVQEIPVRRNPLFFPGSPRNCEVHGRVVLMGPSGTGDGGCAIPQGKAVGLTPDAAECSTAEGNGNTYRKLRQCAARLWRQNGTGYPVRLRIDGKRVRQARAWTFTSMGRVVDLPKHNIWSAPPGPTKSVTRGLFYMVKPLGVGRHVIRFAGDRYRFRVEAPQ